MSAVSRKVFSTAIIVTNIRALITINSISISKICCVELCSEKEIPTTTGRPLHCIMCTEDDVMKKGTLKSFIYLFKLYLNQRNALMSDDIHLFNESNWITYLKRYISSFLKPVCLVQRELGEDYFKNVRCSFWFVTKKNKQYFQFFNIY